MPPFTSPLHVAVMGAGAVGCYFGGMLARAGHDVTLIGRAAHVRAIEQAGLRMQTQSFDAQVAVRASTSPEAARGAQLVLFCVKSTDTATSAAELLPHLAPDALVVTLQNGVDNADRLRAVLREAGAPNEVAAAVVYVATDMGGPGHVRHHGRGELVIEPSTRSDALSTMLEAAGVPTEVSANVRGALWFKLIVNCAYNALSAIPQLPYGQLVQGAGVAQVMNDVMAECLAVAKAEGVQLPGDVAAEIQRIGVTMPGQYSSTAQDLARHKLTEIDHLNGHVIQRGLIHGVPTPANRVLHTLVKLIESRSTTG